MLYINGEWRTDGEKVDVINPATGKAFDTITKGGAEETEEAVAAATEAFKTWKDTPGVERGAYLAKVVAKLRERSEELAEIVTKENGKPLVDARKEVGSTIAYFEWYAEEAKRLYGDVLPPSQAEKHLMVLRQPVGVVGAITPWNFPLSMIARKLAPALAAGCTVVLKPAELTPLSAIKVYECFHEAGLPKGVANLVFGHSPTIGGVLTSHPNVRKIAFTGSTRVGKLLMKQASDTVKKVSMELGGHAPYIVFEDADLEQAAQGVINSKFINAGQTCISTNRIYVQESVVDEFSEILTEKTKELKVGDGLAEGTTVGPLINEGAIEKVTEHIEDAVAKNGKVIAGGKKTGDGQGYFFEPTIIQGATDDMQIATDETFGPVAPIFTFKTEEEITERANHAEYGLAGYCFTKDLGRSIRMMRALEFGIVGINDPTPIVIQAPFGGFKESGMGKEGGKYGLYEYLEEKFVSIHP